MIFCGDPWENRTPVFAVRGRCLSRLTKGPYQITDILYHKMPRLSTVFCKKVRFVVFFLGARLRTLCLCLFSKGLPKSGLKCFSETENHVGEAPMHKRRADRKFSVCPRLLQKSIRLFGRSPILIKIRKIRGHVPRIFHR